MSKILGLDYGEKRCGISITDDLRLIASPLEIKSKRIYDRKNNKISYWDS